MISFCIQGEWETSSTMATAGLGRDCVSKIFECSHSWAFKCHERIWSTAKDESHVRHLPQSDYVETQVLATIGLNRSRITRIFCLQLSVRDHGAAVSLAPRAVKPLRWDFHQFNVLITITDIASQCQTPVNVLMDGDVQDIWKDK